ncbi:hypothetical protein NEPAR08_2590 [Nematocida parisii]|nr:hypothetical protein NEPAR03_2551 [Nematocida parisii]KAI5131993.1 hypothetical protein NEPAR08_2590 [Nematocida parisii]
MPFLLFRCIRLSLLYLHTNYNKPPLYTLSILYTPCLYFYFFSLLLSLYTLYSTIPLLTPEYHPILTHSLCSLLTTAHPNLAHSVPPAFSAACPLSRALSRPFFFLAPPVSRANFFLPCLLFLPSTRKHALCTHSTRHTKEHTPGLCRTHGATPCRTSTHTLAHHTPPALRE